MGPHLVSLHLSPSRCRRCSEWEFEVTAFYRGRQAFQQTIFCPEGLRLVGSEAGDRALPGQPVTLPDPGASLTDRGVTGYVRRVLNSLGGGLALWRVGQRLCARRLGHCHAYWAVGEELLPDCEHGHKGEVPKDVDGSVFDLGPFVAGECPSWEAVGGWIRVPGPGEARLNSAPAPLCPGKGWAFPLWGSNWLLSTLAAGRRLGPSTAGLRAPAVAIIGGCPNSGRQGCSSVASTCPAGVKPCVPSPGPRERPAGQQSFRALLPAELCSDDSELGCAVV